MRKIRSLSAWPVVALLAVVVIGAYIYYAPSSGNGIPMPATLEVTMATSEGLYSERSCVAAKGQPVKNLGLRRNLLHDDRVLRYLESTGAVGECAAGTVFFFPDKLFVLWESIDDFNQEIRRTPPPGRPKMLI